MIAAEEENCLAKPANLLDAVLEETRVRFAKASMRFYRISYTGGRKREGKESWGEGS
jgi:hypothetical protein